MGHQRDCQRQTPATPFWTAADRPQGYVGLALSKDPHSLIPDGLDAHRYFNVITLGGSCIEGNEIRQGCSNELPVIGPRLLESLRLEPLLNTERIIAELEAERDRLDAAIAALRTSSRDGRKPGPGKRHRLSAAARRRISEGMKKRWAVRKRASAS